MLLRPPPRHLEKCCKAVTLLRLHCLLSRSWRRQRGRCPLSRGAGKQEFPFRDWLQRITWLLRNMRLTTAHFPLPSHIHLSRGHKSAWWETQDGWSAGWDAGSPHRVTARGRWQTGGRACFLLPRLCELPSVCREKFLIAEFQPPGWESIMELRSHTACARISALMTISWGNAVRAKHLTRRRRWYLKQMIL